MFRPMRLPPSGLFGFGRHFLAVALVVTMAACASEILPDTATMPNGALNTNGVIDLRSLDVAADDFAHAINVRHRQRTPSPPSTTWAAS